MDRCWELKLGGQAIRDRCGDVSSFSQFHAKGVVAITLSSAKTAAVDADHGREGAFAGFWPSQIQLKMLIIGIRVFDPFFPDDGVGNRRSSKNQSAVQQNASHDASQ
jgi:hypothetical protein